MSDVLGRKAIAKTGPGHYNGEGRVIGYCDAPTVIIQLEDGTHMNWRADLCEFSDWTDADEVKFLRAEIERLKQKG